MNTFHLPRLGALALVAGLLSGCAASDATYLPVHLAPVGVRLPSQQLAVSEAAKKAASGLNFTDFRGKSAVVEIHGMFPHSHHDALDYIQSLVEGRMALAGMMVRPATYQPHFTSGGYPPQASEDEEATPQGADHIEVRHYAPDDTSDYRVVIAVGAAGANLRVITGTETSRYYDGVVSIVVVLIPQQPDLRAVTLEARGNHEHRIAGPAAETPYTDEY